MYNLIEQSGLNAGRVWETLNIYGPLTENQLLDKTNLNKNDLFAAIGWLARENKIYKVGKVYTLDENKIDIKLFEDKSGKNNDKNKTQKKSTIKKISLKNIKSAFITRSPNEQINDNEIGVNVSKSDEQFDFNNTTKFSNDETFKFPSSLENDTPSAKTLKDMEKNFFKEENNEETTMTLTDEKLIEKISALKEESISKDESSWKEDEIRNIDTKLEKIRNKEKKFY